MAHLFWSLNSLGKSSEYICPTVLGTRRFVRKRLPRRAATRCRLQTGACGEMPLRFCAAPLGERASAMALAIDGFSATMRRVRGSEDMMARGAAQRR